MWMFVNNRLQWNSGTYWSLPTTLLSTTRWWWNWQQIVSDTRRSLGCQMTMLAGSAMPRTFSRRGDIVCLKTSLVAEHGCFHSAPPGMIEQFYDRIRENVWVSNFRKFNAQSNSFDFLFERRYDYDPSHAWFHDDAHGSGKQRCIDRCIEAGLQVRSL